MTDAEEVKKHYEPRQAEPDTTFGYTSADGSQKEIKSSSSGIVRPEDDEQLAILDSFDLPVHKPAPAAADKPKSDADKKGE